MKIQSLILLVLITSALSSAWGAEGGGEPLTIDMGKAKFNALLQSWTLNDTTNTTDAKLNFRIRRAEMRFTGSVHPNTRWFVMIDPAKNLNPVLGNDNKVLQDVGIGFNVIPEIELVVGQFKIPANYEGLIPSNDLLFPERSYIGRTYGDRREQGFMADYNRKPLRVRMMISNGQVVPAGGPATNIDDTNNAKDFNGRVDYVASDDVKVGVFTSQSTSTLGFSSRIGANFQYSTSIALLRVEGLSAKELSIDRNGFSAEGGYYFMPMLQGALRIESFQQTTAPEVSSRTYTLGANYYMEGNNLKLQLAWSFLSDTLGNNGGYRPNKGSDGSLIILNVQAAL